METKRRLRTDTNEIQSITWAYLEDLNSNKLENPEVDKFIDTYDLLKLYECE